MTQEKELRPGFTTGAAAAASVKAAMMALLTCRTPSQVEIRFLTGEKKTIPVKTVTVLSPTSCRASVIKDAGDDPDITHKAEIGALVTLKPGSPGIVITGGKGVGRVTKPGLEVAVGEPAINSGPRQMIEEAVYGAYQQLCLPFRHQVSVEVFVPKGEVLAKKTLNARLGILGGISILGTTGVVRPLSHDAYIATIRSGISVALANGSGTLVFTTGRRSERFAMGIFPEIKEDAFIQTGDFFKAGLDMVLEENAGSKAAGGKTISRVTYTVFFGKAVKMALGFEHTHAAKSELTLETLAQWAKDITKDTGLARHIKEANTARHAFSFIFPQFPGLLAFLGKKAWENALGFAKHKIDIRIVILDFEGEIAFDSDAPIR